VTFGATELPCPIRQIPSTDLDDSRDSRHLPPLPMCPVARPLAPPRSLGTSHRCLQLLRIRMRFSELIISRTRRARKRLYTVGRQQTAVAPTLSVQNKEMAPVHILAEISWLIIMSLTRIEAHQQRMKLKTRPSDGAALCAMDPPTLSAKLSERLKEAPEVVRCSMSCTADVGCKHFNYISTESNSCHLYRYTPTSFDVSPNCQHFYEPGQQI